MFVSAVPPVTGTEVDVVGDTWGVVTELVGGDDVPTVVNGAGVGPGVFSAVVGGEGGVCSSDRAAAATGVTLTPSVVTDVVAVSVVAAVGAVDGGGAAEDVPAAESVGTSEVTWAVVTGDGGLLRTFLVVLVSTWAGTVFGTGGGGGILSHTTGGVTGWEEDDAGVGTGEEVT